MTHATPIRRDTFPNDFVWGVATSAFQIEGASEADGKGTSIWDDFCRLPNAIADSSNGTVACDHYSKWESDLDLVSSLGVDAYRFSISWPRVQPKGSGKFNETGFAFYDRLIDGMLARGLKPYCTLNHWDLPSGLQTSGGWSNRDTVQRFVDYACEVNSRFGNRLVSICTHNEPWVIAVLGHQTGSFAPGATSRLLAMQVAHNLLLSHGLTVTALRQLGCKASLGIVLNMSPSEGAQPNAADTAMAELEFGINVRWYLEPLLLGNYPSDVWKHLSTDVPTVAAGDMDCICAPLDFLGINYYMRTVVSADPTWKQRVPPENCTDMGWEIYPQGLSQLLLRLHHDYDLPPIVITENGAAFQDEVNEGSVHDSRRQEYLASHLIALNNAMHQGVRVDGYFIWSLLDNFEWSSGYTKRFGIVHVDYPSQQRILKDSAYWYRDFCNKKNSRK